MVRCHRLGLPAAATDPRGLAIVSASNTADGDGVYEWVVPGLLRE